MLLKIKSRILSENVFHNLGHFNLRTFGVRSLKRFLYKLLSVENLSSDKYGVENWSRAVNAFFDVKTSLNEN